LPELLRGAPEHPEPLHKTAAADDVASLLFTSGTTGKPKGVLLTHRNFSSLASKLATLFDLRVGHGLLSVLPLHHTFEFTCGLLVPLLLGAEITYLDELTAERLASAGERQRPRPDRRPCLVAAPAPAPDAGESPRGPTAIRAASRPRWRCTASSQPHPFNVGSCCSGPSTESSGELAPAGLGGSALRKRCTRRSTSWAST